MTHETRCIFYLRITPDTLLIMKLTTIWIAGMLVLLSCQPAAIDATPKIKPGMIKVTILYPNGEDKTFDMEYYSTRHMPLVASSLGSALKFYSIDSGISGRTPDEPSPFLAIGYLYFDKLSDYQTSFAANAEKIVSDIPNYTNVQPIVQISEVLE